MIYVITKGFYMSIVGIYTDRDMAREKVREIQRTERLPESLAVWAYPPNSTDYVWMKQFTN